MLTLKITTTDYSEMAELIDAISAMPNVKFNIHNYQRPGKLNQHLVNLVEDCFERIQHYTGVSRELIKDRTRVNMVKDARHLFFLFMFRLTISKEISLIEIGGLCGRVDHSTVIYALKSVRDLLESDKKLKAIHDAIEGDMLIRYRYKRD